MQGSRRVGAERYLAFDSGQNCQYMLLAVGKALRRHFQPMVEVVGERSHRKDFLKGEGGTRMEIEPSTWVIIAV